MRARLPYISVTVVTAHDLAESGRHLTGFPVSATLYLVSTSCLSIIMSQQIAAADEALLWAKIREMLPLCATFHI